MKNDKIIYIANYIDDECLALRKNGAIRSEATFNKVNCLCRHISFSGYDVTVLSPAYTNNSSFKYHPGFSVKKADFSLIYCSAIDIPVLNILFSILSVFVTLIKLRGEYDKILFYNYVPQTFWPALLAGIFLKKNIYLDYEDGYYALSDKSKLTRAVTNFNEFIGNFFISGALLINEAMKKRVTANNLQLVNGIIDHNLYLKFKDGPAGTDLSGPVNITYSGAINKLKGIDRFLTICEHLINNYRDKDFIINITGKGDMEELVRSCAAKYDGHIKYHGFLSREELIGLYKKTDVFISMQDAAHPFSEASYPSKVFDFLSTGKLVLNSFELSDRQIQDELERAINREKSIVNNKMQLNKAINNKITIFR